MQTFRKNVEDMSLPFLLKYFENDPYPCIKWHCRPIILLLTMIFMFMLCTYMHVTVINQDLLASLVLAVKRQTTVPAYFLCGQLLLFDFACRFVSENARSAILTVSDADLSFDHRLQRWTNLISALSQRMVCAWIYSPSSEFIVT